MGPCVIKKKTSKLVCRTVSTDFNVNECVNTEKMQGYLNKLLMCTRIEP